MVPAAALHDRERFYAIPGYNPDASVEAGHMHLFGSMLSVVVGAFGAPRDLFEMSAILLENRPDFLHALRALEAMLRRILLMLAAKATDALKPVKARARTTRAKRAPSETTEPAFKPFYAEGLDVAFAYQASERDAGPRRAYPRKVRRTDLLYGEANPLAARLEALIRIYADPRAAVLRLRRAIARHQARYMLCARILHEPAGLAAEHPHLLVAVRSMEEDAQRAGKALVRPSG